MELGANGHVEVSQGALFRIGSQSDFKIGESSTWLITGTLIVDKDSSLLSQASLYHAHPPGRAATM